MTLENKYNRGTHGDSSLMLSTVVLSNENQTCRGWEAPTSTGGEDVTIGVCNPWPILEEDKTETDSEIKISYDFLKESSDIFENWKSN